MTDLFSNRLQVVNVGLYAFAEAIELSGGNVVDLDWRPPAEGDPAVARALAFLSGDEIVKQANETALDRYLQAAPVLTGVGFAGDVISDLQERTLLHSGPPVAWQDMCGPMQGAVTGAILFEGWADGLEAAQALAASGAVTFAPCHHHEAVGPMAGVISPSMPVWIVENGTLGNRAFSNLNEGLGQVLRFGANGPEVIERLRCMAGTLAPALADALQQLGELEPSR